MVSSDQLVCIHVQWSAVGGVMVHSSMLTRVKVW